MKVTVTNIDESDIPVIRIDYFKSCEKWSLILFNDMISKKYIYIIQCVSCVGEEDDLTLGFELRLRFFLKAFISKKKNSFIKKRNLFTEKLNSELFCQAPITCHVWE